MGVHTGEILAPKNSPTQQIGTQQIWGRLKNKCEQFTQDYFKNRSKLQVHEQTWVSRPNLKGEFYGKC